MFPEARYFYYNDMIFVVPRDVYYPREDTMLFCEFLSKHLNTRSRSYSKILDMGCGCGVLGIVASKILRKTVVCCDVNTSAINASLFNANLNHARIRAIESDLFSRLKNETFDLILFNPPYLPPAKEDMLVEESERAAWCGGGKLISRFLSEARNHLTENGRIYLLYSTLTEKIDFGAHGFDAALVESKKLPWEKLFIAELRKREL